VLKERYVEFPEMIFAPPVSLDAAVENTEGMTGVPL
jgi:hypothetical protein